ncbi:hypothetical protein DFQ27_006057 [Actinomortierella ambigua]|uniref:Galactose oxidase n=1 Tax=Actinomortierella ambigua TaxID=1343610 RepID=A0A9P6Q0I6_9FUNG|nr:hypothetical protein DFQ27_006057 [Actinomortierella ambigua]
MDTPPQPNRRMGYTLFKDHLYLVGGFFGDTPLNQFYSLDLSTSWADGKAPWTKLRDGPALSHLAVAPISSQNFGGAEGSLLVIGGAEAKADSFFSLYNIASDSWSTVSVTAPYPSLEGHAAAVEPSTGKVHIFGGYGTTKNGNETLVASLNRLTVYDHVNKAISSKNPAANDQALAEPGAVWLESRKSFVLFGGSRDVIPPKRQGLGGGQLDEYDPSSQQWKTFATTGDIPPDRADHCMAANDDGTKVVVFGGSDMDTFMSDIYTLDVASAKWTKGPNAPKSRIRMACAIYKNQLVVVGGSEERRRESMHDSTPAIFNLNSNHWTHQYNVDGSDNESGGSSSTGAIIGGAVAVVAVGAVAAFFVIRKRRARRHEVSGFSTVGNTSSGTGSPIAGGAGAGAAGSFNELKHESSSSSGTGYGQDIQLGKLNNNGNYDDDGNPFADQYNPHYATTNYGYGSPQLSAYNGGATSPYATSPAMVAVSSPGMQQAEYLHNLRQDEPVSTTVTIGSSNSSGHGGHYGSTPLLPPQPASAHLSNYSHDSPAEYHQAVFAANPYGGGRGNATYGQAGYGYASPSSSYATPSSSARPTPSAHSNSPQDYTNYVPPNGMPSPGDPNSGFIPPPL